MSKKSRVKTLTLPNFNGSFPPQIERLSVKTSTLNDTLEDILKQCPNLVSLYLGSAFVDTFALAPLQGTKLTHLKIGVLITRTQFHASDLFQTFPNLKTLEIGFDSFTNSSVTLYPSQTLESLSITAERIAAATVRSIFTNYPNLQSLTLCYKEGPRRIAKPATHPNLALTVTR